MCAGVWGCVQGVGALACSTYHALWLCQEVDCYIKTKPIEGIDEGAIRSNRFVLFSSCVRTIMCAYHHAVTLTLSQVRPNL